MKIIKKDGTLEEYNEQKIINACNKAARRAMIELSEKDYQKICNSVWDRLVENDLENTEIYEIHNIVESVLEEYYPIVAKMYKEYRNYKKDFIHMMDKVYEESQKIRYIGDKDNANTDSALVATKRSLIFNSLNSELYKKFFLTTDEKQAAKDGYIYIHDRNARLDSINCCLFKMGEVMSSGFEMGNVWYNEPKTLDTAFDVMGDIILSVAAQQYGGFTVPRVDSILAPYAEKSYWKYRKEYARITEHIERDNSIYVANTLGAEEYALENVKRDFEQGWQGIEYKLNTVGSSRGDYPFVTMTFGLDTSRFGKMASITFLNVHKEGQGKPGHKRPVLFPKLVFLYDKNIHGKGCINEDVFEAGIECSMKTMYPDWLSLTGEGYIPSMYKKYGEVISPMGCVDGQEIVTYKFNEKLYVEAFERMWYRLADYFKIQNQSVNSPHLYMDLTNVEIYDTKNGFVNTKRIIRNVSDDWVDVHLSNGRRLLCTSDHPFEVLGKGEVHTSELVIGDKMRINSSQYSENRVSFISDRAWLLGFLLCDGCYQNNRIFASVAATDEDDIADKFISVVKEQFGLHTDVVLRERGVKGIYKDLCIRADKYDGLQKMISYLSDKFGGINKLKRQIPNEVFSWNKEAKLSFLAGMIDADGHINNHSHGGCTVQIGSTNKELSLQQMALAQALDMPARMYYNHYSKHNPELIRYRIEFRPTKDLLNYIACEKKIHHYIEPISDLSANVSEVIGITPLDGCAYSYDVTTDSEHFEVSGIYTHNCRAFLSPWYERGGMNPADENDKVVYEGRFNLGAISLHLPMILAKAKRESKDFYEVLDYYMEMIRGLHKRTYDYIGEMRASVNPVAYCQGGFYGGYLKPEEKIRKLLPPMTMSFGITALNELQELYNGKSLVEDGQFALDVMQYINDKITVYKKEDNILYAIYGTPAESLCFSGDTVVQAYNGHKFIKDIHEGDLVYSYNEKSKKIELKPVIAAILTKKDADVVKVTFTNGQSVICTPNHPFATRKMIQDSKGKFIKEIVEYVSAKDLVQGNRVKSNYIIINADGHYKCTTDQFIHDINAEYFFGAKPENYVVHHKNENKLDNSKDNLEYILDKTHRKHHIGETIKKYQYKSEYVKGNKNPFYGKRHTDETKEQNKLSHLGANNACSKSVVKLDKNGNIIDIYESRGEAERKTGYSNISYACNGRYSTKENPHEYKGFVWYYASDVKDLCSENHKVKSVEYLTEKIPVYDIEVADNHNFYVGGDDGILVHNCGLQIEQFRKQFGIIEKVSDRTYVSNSFHCGVWEEITPIEKQSLENRFWNLFNGGKIQYCRYPISYNKEAVKTLIHRAMDMGLYEGVNLSLSYCEDCGYEQLEMDECPKCGSKNITKIDRMNGYLGFTRVHGDTRYNKSKNDEIADRKSM